MCGWLRLRLSVMMFGQYFVLGAWVVPLATYLKEPRPRGLGFTGTEVALVYNMLAVGGLVAPLFVGVLADRLFAAQHLKGVLHLAAAACLVLAAHVCEGPREAPVGALALALLGFALCYYTTITLSNIIPLRHLAEPSKQFGSVRLFGTVGWIAAGLTVGLALDGLSPQPLLLAAAAALALGCFSFFLPHTPPMGKARSLADLFGVRALGLFRDRSFGVFVACALLITMVQAFYNTFLNRFLTELPVPAATAVQTVAQAGEIASLLLLPLALHRFGMKAVLATGLAGWVLRYGAFATLWAPAVVAGLPLHGFSFTFFYVAAALYVDRLAPPDLRAGTQAVVTFVTMGLGALLGNAWAGWAVDRATVSGATDWVMVWLAPGAVAAVVTGVFVAMFRAPAGPFDS